VFGAEEWIALSTTAIAASVTISTGTTCGGYSAYGVAVGNGANSREKHGATRDIDSAASRIAAVASETSLTTLSASASVAALAGLSAAAAIAAIPTHAEHVTKVVVGARGDTSAGATATSDSAKAARHSLAAGFSSSAIASTATAKARASLHCIAV
jgi:hypothetical protein